MPEDTSLFDDPELVQEFVVEAEELLESLSTDLVVLEKKPDDPELLNRVFRAFHTIKGTAGFLGFDQLVQLAHATEDVLNRLRKGELGVTPALMDVLLASQDLVSRLVSRVRDGKHDPVDLGNILDRLAEVMRTESPVQVIQQSAILEKAPTDKKKRSSKRKAPAARSVHESMPSEELRTDPTPVLGPDEFALPRAEVEHAQEQSEEKSSQTIRIDVAKLDDLMALVGELVLERNRLVQINRQLTAGMSAEHLEESLAETAARFNYVTSELQSAVLKARMLPIEKVVRRYPRMVRDLARQTGKEAELIISGEETEVDKSVFDEIGEPLVHIIRNAVDHGIEAPEERVRLGKPRCGQIRLEAEHRANHILISVTDDGRGINSDKIAAKALERGLVTEARLRSMDQREILEFILLPGFSTAEEISNVSGRGVGMDVVRAKIKKLNGVLDINSELGKGTKMSLVLPLTLAIIQSLLIEVGEETLAVPLSSVVEVLRVDRSEVGTIRRSEVLRLRDQVLPLVHLDELLYGAPRSPLVRSYVVVIGVADRRLGVVVDRLVGQEEVVIKSLGEFLPSVNGIAGGTIRGDGHVRLMLDPAGLVDVIDRQRVA
ncbi:MAG: chemotaxis protein CheA [Chloroflexota bacterium]|nr:MAG: chemotaxis protein CheA [Chloroflexota bacterium]